MSAHDYEEMPGYPKESYSLGELTATRKLLCTWDDRHAVYLGFMPLTGVGASYVYGGGIASPALAIGGTIDPFEAELLDGTVSDPAKSVKESHYTNAIVTITFKTPGAGAIVPIQNPAPGAAVGDLISETIKSTNEFLRMDYTLFKWSSGDPLKEAEAPNRQLRGFVWNVTRHKVSISPTSLNIELLTWANTVNRNAIRSRLLGLPFGVHTLMYLQPQITRLDGSNVRIEMPFAYRNSRWDRYWRAETQQYETIKLIDDTDYDNFPDQIFEDKLGVFV